MRVPTRARFVSGWSGLAAGFLAVCGPGEAMADPPTAQSWSYTSKCYVGTSGGGACRKILPKHNRAMRDMAIETVQVQCANLAGSSAATPPFRLEITAEQAGERHEYEYDSQQHVNAPPNGLLAVKTAIRLAGEDGLSFRVHIPEPPPAFGLCPGNTDCREPLAECEITFSGTASRPGDQPGQ